MAYGIIFDLDGTLADTIDDLKTAVNNMLSILGYESRTKFEIINFINRGARELIRRSLPTTVQSEDFIVDSALHIYELEYEKCYCDKTAPFPGIKEAVAELKAKKFKVGVLSNKQDVFVKTIIYKLFGTDTFDFVLGKTDMPHKPDPKSSIFVAKEMGVKPNKCIFVGDSDVDMHTAQNADMRAIGVSWGYRKPEVLIENGANYIAETPAQLVEHATELVRIIKLEKKMNRKKRRTTAPAPVEVKEEEPNSDIVTDSLNVEIKPLVDPINENSEQINASAVSTEIQAENTSESNIENKSESNNQNGENIAAEVKKNTETE